MQVTLSSTDRIIEVNGVKARVWEGETVNGVRCYAAIAVIAAHCDDDNAEFERDLTEHQPASHDALRCFDLRTIL